MFRVQLTYGPGWRVLRARPVNGWAARPIKVEEKRRGEKRLLLLTTGRCFSDDPRAILADYLASLSIAVKDERAQEARGRAA